MVQKSKSKPARKTAAKKATRRGAAPANPTAPKAKAKARPAKPKSAGKSTPRGVDSRPTAASEPGKARNIFRKKSKAAKSASPDNGAAHPPTPDRIALNGPLLAALDEAMAPSPPQPGHEAQPQSAERRGMSSNFLAPGQGRAPARRPGSGEAQPDSPDTPARTNKLVPTNAVHTTKRRMKRNTWQGPTLGLAAVAVVMAILVLGDDKPPPGISPLEQRAETPARTPRYSHVPRIQDPAQAAPDRAPTAIATPAKPARIGDPVAQGPASQGDDPEGGATQSLKVLELVELERMLKRLDMSPSQPDGIVDGQTATAIRMYQQIAGLPVDGEPSPELLDDMREVVKMMDGEN